MSVAFVILFQGRSGSSLLIDALSRHRDIDARGEALACKADAQAQLNWTKSYFERSARPIAGFKTKLTDIFDAAGFAVLLRALGCRIIHLEREDLVRQAVSWIRADALYRRSGVHNLSADIAPLAPLTLDWTQLRERIEALKQGRARLSAYVNELGLPALRVSYEQLSQRTQFEFERVLDFLGAAPCALETDLRKATPDDLSQSILNWQDIEAELRHLRLPGSVDGAISASGLSS